MKFNSKNEDVNYQSYQTFGLKINKFRGVLCDLVQPTHLTDVTVNVKAAVQGHDPHRLLLALFGHDGLAAHRAARSVLPVDGGGAERKRQRSRFNKHTRAFLHTAFPLPVKVVYAVYLRRGVHGEGHAVQAAVANHAGEAAGVIGLPHGPQDTVQDGLGAL